MNIVYSHDLKRSCKTPVGYNTKADACLMHFYEKIIVSEKCIENIFIVVGYWVNQLQGQRNGQSFQFPFKGKVNI